MLSLLHVARLLVLFFIPTKILSNYLKYYWSYGLHNILVSGELTTYISKIVRVVSCMRHASETPLHSYLILSKYVYGYQSYGAHKDASTDGRHTDGYISRTYLSGDKNEPKRLICPWRQLRSDCTSVQADQSPCLALC